MTCCVSWTSPCNDIHALLIFTNKTRKQEVCVDASAVRHRTQMPGWICSRNNGWKGSGAEGFEEGNRGPRDHVVRTGLYAGSTAFLSATSARYCAVVSLNLTPGEPREGAGKVHEHYFFECVIVTNDDRKYKSCGIHVELGLPASAGTSLLLPPFPHRPLFTCSRYCFTRLHISKQANSVSQTSVP